MLLEHITHGFNMELKLIRSRDSNFVLTIDGYTYYKHDAPVKNITKWVCKCKKVCYAWVKTAGSGPGITLVRGGPKNIKTQTSS